LLHWHDLENPSDGDRVAITKMQIYDKYNSNTMDGDVCVLTLASPTAYTPIVLDGGSTAQAGEVNIAAGWGNTSPTGSAFPALAQEVGVPLVSNEVCNAKDAYNGEITAGMMCAGFSAGGKDSCQGDSGGPLFLDGGKPGVATLTGVVSWGYGCAQPNAYGVYARVSVFKGWIDQVTDNAAQWRSSA
jgi:secreted trypsin-like serine protease